MVDGVVYLIDEDTDMEDDLAAGDYVELRYYENEDGDLILIDVDVENDEMATPEPSDEDDIDDGGDDSADDDQDDDSDDDDQDDDHSDDDQDGENGDDS